MFYEYVSQVARLVAIIVPMRKEYGHDRSLLSATTPFLFSMISPVISLICGGRSKSGPRSLAGGDVGAKWEI